MLLRLLSAAALVILTAAVHAAGNSMLLRAILRSHALAMSGFRAVTTIVICMTCWMVVVHLTEIAIWAVFYYWQEIVPDAGSAFFLSGGAYTTAGYSGLTIPKEWQIFALLESITGILMAGLSTGLFFALVNQWVSKWMQRRIELGT